MSIIKKEEFKDEKIIKGCQLVTFRLAGNFML